MRKIVLAAAAAGVFALSACNKPNADSNPAPNPTPTEVPLSAADKAAVDALGTDLVKLAEMVKTATGEKRVYADGKLAELLPKATDAELVDTVFDILPVGSGYAKGAALSAKGRLRK